MLARPTGFTVEISAIIHRTSANYCPFYVKMKRSSVLVALFLGLAQASPTPDPRPLPHIVSDTPDPEWEAAAELLRACIVSKVGGIYFASKIMKLVEVLNLLTFRRIRMPRIDYLPNGMMISFCVTR